jgi:membrane associated rhomboid family serine protease
MKRFFANRAWLTWVLVCGMLAMPFAYAYGLTTFGIVPDLRALAWVCFVPADFTNALTNFNALELLHSVAMLFTNQFFHLDTGHLIGNLVPIVLFGIAVEKRLGARNFLLAFLASGVVGGLVHWAFEPQSPIPLLGASGALGGVFGIYTTLFVTREIEWGNRHYFLMALMFVIFILPNLIAVLGVAEAQDMRIAVNLHIGAYLFGLLLGCWHKLARWEPIPSV